MSLVVDWGPTASLANIQLRAEILAKIRRFFAEHSVLEVETPLLCQATVTDPHLMSFETFFMTFESPKKTKLFLQTSPEYAMKRLLAAGCGAIYQICKAFRNGEQGRRHNPEFTLLEWYRLNFDHHALMDEVNEFLQYILGTTSATRLSYAEVFKIYLDIDPHRCSISSLINCARKNNLDVAYSLPDNDRDVWLDLLLTHLIEPNLGQEHPVFIYDYPASQAALAKTRKEGGYTVGERFEVYWHGIELANGYHELADAKEQRYRFVQDNDLRSQLNLPEIPIDEYFITALQHNFPNCAGVALGVDRLILLAANAKSLDEVLTFPIENA
jgi:elongation factor P--(R)-beta-lysine ligase